MGFRNLCGAAVFAHVCGFRYRESSVRDMHKRDIAAPVLDERAYERLVQSVVDYAIFMLDPQGRVATWNPGAHRIKGYSSEEIIGEHFSRFYTEKDRKSTRLNSSHSS